MFGSRFHGPRGREELKAMVRSRMGGAPFPFWPGRGDEGGRGGRDDGGRGRRMGRLFAHGDLHLVILSLIADRPSHGYELIKSIEALANGAYSPSPGTIYPALTLLEEQGYIRAESSEGSRKLYAITGDGRAYLAANQPTLEALRARIAEAGSRAEHEPPASVVRAIQNLRFALHLRLARGDVSEEGARKIAEALDRAAGEIERS